MLVYPSTQVVHQLTLVTLSQARHLQVVTAEESKSALRSTATQHRARNNSIGARLQFTGGQLAEACAQTGAYQTRLLDHRTGQRYNALGPQLACGEQF